LIAALTSDQVRALNVNDLSGLAAIQIAAMSSDQINVLKTDQIARLSTAQIRAIETLDIVGLYKLSDKFFKIAQENILDGFKTFNYEDELINKPTDKYILKPVDDYIVQPVDKFTNLTTEGTNKLTKAVDDYAVKPSVCFAKFVDNKDKQIAKTPSKIKQKLNH
jgi:hypothetical protein